MSFKGWKTGHSNEDKQLEHKNEQFIERKRKEWLKEEANRWAGRYDQERATGHYRDIEKLYGTGSSTGGAPARQQCQKYFEEYGSGNSAKYQEDTANRYGSNSAGGAPAHNLTRGLGVDQHSGCGRPAKEFKEQGADRNKADPNSSLQNTTSFPWKLKRTF